MKYLNLDHSFNPFPEGAPLLAFDDFLFSGGEVHIKLKESALDVFVSARLNSSNDVMRLLLAVDALRRSGTENISVFIPYLPYARQDRVMVPGEPLSVKVMCDLLERCKFKHIYLFDVHSEVSPALLDNCHLFSNETLVRHVLALHPGPFHLVSPDAGALKKVYKLAQAISFSDEIVLAGKLRDVSTGKIKKMTIDREDLEGKDCFIVDDICDGGATFTGLAQALKERNAGRVFLIVSHGIFSHGETELAGALDHIYTTDSIKDEASALITRVSLASLHLKFS